MHTFWTVGDGWAGAWQHRWGEEAADGVPLVGQCQLPCCLILCVVYVLVGALCEQMLDDHRLSRCGGLMQSVFQSR